jgi:protein phosphatase
MNNAPLALVALRTDPGKSPEKQVNEDACAEEATRFGHLVVVCDGMGGHAGGREASQLALRVIREGFEKADAGAAPRDVLAQAIREANRRVFTMTSPDEVRGPAHAGRPGSTVVAVLVTPEGTEIAHVGDSRAYLAHAGQVVQLTKDHSAVQRLVDDGLISPAEAARHPEANKIMRALGISPDVDVDVRAQPVPHVAGDVFVLCSDGLSDLVQKEEMLAIAAAAPPGQAAGQLVDLANARGGYDNITVAIVRTSENATPRAREPVAATVDGTSPPQAERGQHQTETMGAVPMRVGPQTVVQGPAIPMVPAGAAPRPPGGEPPASARSGSRARNSVAVVGLVIAVFALGFVVHALYTHELGRGGAHRLAPDVASEPLTGHATPHVELQPLEPGSAPAPAAPEIDAAIEPLQPLVPDAGGPWRRWRKSDPAY